MDTHLNWFLPSLVDTHLNWFLLLTVAPAVLMLLGVALGRLPMTLPRKWMALQSLIVTGLMATLAAPWLTAPANALPTGLASSTVVNVVAVLVQFLGLIIASFSSRYLRGEPRQPSFIGNFAGVLASVQWLLLADHWLLLITAWAAVGVFLQQLLCFYPERPFAQLAAHKKQIADRVADLLLIVAGGLAWHTVGSGSLTDLFAHVEARGTSPILTLVAVLVALAVLLRTALLPVHGWLIQVMEAPTPVSALLHAGVVNLGGFVLIRFAPLLQEADLARIMLAMLGLLSAVLAGMVMLTRISIKVRLAWSTTAQMGFMVLECALGLYTLALLHLIGHSLYKAHTFLAASGIVSQTRRAQLLDQHTVSSVSLVLAPVLSTGLILLLTLVTHDGPWPLWWTVILGAGFAPLLWWPMPSEAGLMRAKLVGSGLLMLLLLTVAAMLGKALPLQLPDQPDYLLGWIAAFGLVVLYLFLAAVRKRATALPNWRRWSYAGFYLDEAYTRLALKLWPADWGQGSRNYLR